ncbi:hypothetical protein T492DRAFT_192376 [Pavlovales sp. CCMP2436]|nr:hypothetical protein T492DRAFT_192376 [Pavlovales sp. CCMP2436]
MNVGGLWQAVWRRSDKQGYRVARRTDLSALTQAMTRYAELENMGSLILQAATVCQAVSQQSPSGLCIHISHPRQPVPRLPRLPLLQVHVALIGLLRCLPSDVCSLRPPRQGCGGRGAAEAGRGVRGAHTHTLWCECWCMRGWVDRSTSA